MQPVSDIVKHMIIINVLVFVLVYFIPLGQMLPDLKLWFPLMNEFKPYQLVTHMFMHASIGHIAFNMLGLFFLGPHVERYMGARKFLLLYLLSGLGALLAHLGVQYFDYSQGVRAFGPVLGASGAVYGVVIAFAVLFPNVRLQLLFPPIPVRAKYLAMAYIAYDLFSGLSGANTGVAHFAHLGGAIAGAILTYLWYKRR